jgi:hypothetical protein
MIYANSSEPAWVHFTQVPLSFSRRQPLRDGKIRPVAIKVNKALAHGLVATSLDIGKSEMPCTQCGRPAFYNVGDAQNPHPLCLSCWAVAEEVQMMKWL